MQREMLAALGTVAGLARRAIDAGARVIAPAFIDAPTHLDVFLVQSPSGLPVINCGVTRVAIEDCGASRAPVLPGSDAAGILISCSERVLNCYVDSSTPRWSSLPDCLNTLDGHVDVNVGMLAPRSSVRLTVMGQNGRPPPQPRRNSTP